MDSRGLQRFFKESEGKPYGGWRRLAGVHRFSGIECSVDHVQGDVYAPASRLSLRIPLKNLALARQVSDPVERLAIEDLALREFAARLPQESVLSGDAAGGRLSTLKPGPEIRSRSASRIEGNETLVLRFTLALPAESRRILTAPVEEILFFRLPALAADLALKLDAVAVNKHLSHLRRCRALREAVEAKGLCAFVANGAMLARKDGHPVEGATPFKAPADFTTSIALPDGTVFEGLGIPKGLSVLVGPAFHGKTTLLEAIGQGVFDHVPGDGREACVSLTGTVFPCVEEDRAVRTLDLSYFVKTLPGGRSPKRFATTSASGATSQASSILEALAAGTPLLLLDEDASAANLLTRDERINALFSKGETVTPLAERARALVQAGVSLIVVAGASGRWLDLADHVFVLEDYRPRKALEIPQGPVADQTLPAALAQDLFSELHPQRTLSPTRVKLSGSRLKLGDHWIARLPARGLCEPRARGAAHILLAFLRHSPEPETATLESLRTWHEKWTRNGPDWPDDTAHDLEMPTLHEVIAVAQRFEPSLAEETA
jgi:predicted ABC-class ATPase